MTAARAPLASSRPRLAVIGLGLIGSSTVAAWRGRGLVGPVTGFDLEPATGRRALELGLIDTLAADAGLAAAQADLVLIAVPPRALPATLAAIAADLGAGAVVTDVASVKMASIAAARAALGTAFPRFVGAHPIAGSERSGPDAADGSLFDGRVVVTTPVEGTEPKALDLVESLWRACGAQLQRMPPERHDQIVAAVSHLPHLLAYALVATIAADGQAGQRLPLAGSGFADSTRIAASQPELWVDISLSNRQALAGWLRQLRLTLGVLEQALDQNDAAALTRIYSAAAQVRRAFAAGAAGSARGVGSADEPCAPFTEETA